MPDNIFKAPDSDGTAQQMADTIPDGRAWASKNIDGSVVRKLINSLSVAQNQAQQSIEHLESEFRIEDTTELLREWEVSVGIPDECLGTSDTLEQRRQAVIDRLRKVPIVKLEELQDYIDGLFPGLGVELHPGSEYYTFEFEFEVPFLGDVDEKFIIVAEVPLSEEQFEYEWEMEFEGGINTEQLECILNKVIPGNVFLIIELVG